MTVQRSALAGLRVLDLSRVLAGPWSTQLLADFGADVIKVERPGSGDDSRGWGPPYYEGHDGSRVSAYFCMTNRGKRSVTLDLNDERDLALLRSLALQCDVLVENFRVGTLARLGLDYASLAVDNPGLVYCSISGFGQDGPYAQRPGYDTIVQGQAGLMSITGLPDHSPGGGPLKVGAPVVDVMTGVYACCGILVALAERAHSGRGQFIDLALMDVGVTALSVMAGNFLASGQVPGRHGSALANAVPSDAIRCADGHVMIMVGTNLQFRRLCQCLDLPDLTADPRFATNECRVGSRDALMAILLPRFASRTRADLIESLSAAGVPCGPINDLGQVFEDPQIRHRSVAVDVSDDTFGQMRVLANPLRLSRTPPTHEAPPTRLGATSIDRTRPACHWPPRREQQAVPDPSPLPGGRAE